MKLDYQLTLYTRINSKWIKDLNRSCDTIQVLEENIGRKISDIPCSNIFADHCPRAKEIKENINQWDYTNLEVSAWLKKPLSKWKGNQSYGRTFANDTLDKSLISKLYKELI